MSTPPQDSRTTSTSWWRRVLGGPLSPLTHLVITVGTIYLAEAAVMVVIRALPPISYPLVMLVDSSLLVVLVFPVLYFMLARPLFARIADRQRAELEATVEERTGEVKHANEALRTALDGARQRQGEVAALLDGARTVLNNHDFETTARALFSSCKDLVGAETGYVALLGRDGTTNETVFLDPGATLCSVDPSLSMPVRGLVEAVVNARRTEYDNLPGTSVWTYSVPGGHVTLENVLFAPLALDGAIVGVLGLANKPGGFNDNDARMATAFGELAAVALLNSRSARELREAHDALEARVLERTEELAHANRELRVEIADRERAEVALRESEDRYRTFLQNFQGIAFRSTLGVAPVFFHGAVQSITGYSEAELLAGTPRWQEIIHPDDRAEALRSMEQTRSEPKFSAEREYRIIRRDGQVRWLREYIQNSCDPTGTPTLAQGALYDITEQKQSEGHRAATLALLELFAQKGSRKEYLDAVVELVREWTGVRTVGIRLHDDEGGAPYEALVGFDHGTADTESSGPEVGLGRPCTRATLLTPDPADLPSLTVSGSFHCTDTAGFVDSAAPGEATGCRDECVNAGFASVAVIPIRYRGRVLGAIHLADDRPAGVSTAGLTFIESTVALVGEAVQRFNLEEELRRFAREQSVLYAVATAASSFLDVKGLLESVLDVVLPALDTDAGWVTLSGSAPEDSPRVAVSYGAPEDVVAASGGLPLGSCPSCGSLLCSDAIGQEPQASGACPSLMPELLGGSGLQSLVRTPLSSGGDLLGVLNIAWREPHEFLPAEHAMLRAVGSLVGVALANARLFETARSRARHLATLNEIGQAISSSLDLDEVLASLLEQVRQVTGAQAGFVALKDQTTGALVYRHVAGESEGDLKARSIDPGEGISGYLAFRRIPNDAAFAVPSGAGADAEPAPGPEPSAARLVAPLVVREEVIGIVELCDKLGGAFSEADAKLLESAAAAAAIAVQNARLFDQVRADRGRLQVLSRQLVEVQENERLAVARELHDDAGQALASLKISLRLLEREAGDRPAVVARVAELKHTADGVLENLHRLASNLRPASLDHLGLIATLRQEAGSLSGESGPSVQVEATGFGERRLTPAVETALYRIAQEAMTNAVRHGEAATVDVDLAKEGERIVLVVSDDGVGFDPTTALGNGRLGLVGMQERVELLGGVLHLKTRPGAGTRVVVEVPYADTHLDSR